MITIKKTTRIQQNVTSEPFLLKHLKNTYLYDRNKLYSIVNISCIKIIIYIHITILIIIMLGMHSKNQRHGRVRETEG